MNQSVPIEEWLTTINLKALVDEPTPPRKFIVDNLIPDRDVTDFAGDGGNGKSLLALQLGVAMETATDWIGTIPEPGRFLYVSCEDELDEVRRRYKAICESKPTTDYPDFHIIDLMSAPETELARLVNGIFAFTQLFKRLEYTITDIRPKLMVLDTRTDVFAGNEIDRQQVRTFIRKLRSLCHEYDMAILMLSHPSVQGMSTGTGQSGSTAWGNSVRSRLYLERPKATDGSDPDPDLRILTTKKANYGAIDNTITLRWENGVFRPDGAGPGFLDHLAQKRTADEAFILHLRGFEIQGRHVSDSPGGNYAPARFATADEKIGKRPFKESMERLFKDGKIKIEEFGPPSRRTKKIVEVV